MSAIERQAYQKTEEARARRVENRIENIRRAGEVVRNDMSKISCAFCGKRATTEIIKYSNIYQVCDDHSKI